MTHPPMVDSYLRELLGDLDVEVETTDRGYVLADEPRVRLAVVGNGCALRVLGAAVVADRVEATPALLERINDANAALPFGRLFWQRGEVLVEESVLGGALTAALLDHQLAFLRWAARSQAETLGLAPHPDEPTDTGAAPADDADATPSDRAAPGNATHPLSDVIGPRSSSGPEPRDTAGVAAAPQQPIANAAGYL